MSPLRARVEKGRLVLDEPTALPEGTVVDLRSLIFEIGLTDLPTYVTVVCGLSVTALVAIYIPARRAARLDPAEILRSD